MDDRVMGGVSEASLRREVVAGRLCLHLTGDVRLENNGGFVQMALDLSPDGKTIDASDYQGVSVVVRGNGERYGLHLRTADVTRPWQSYRAQFVAEDGWCERRLAFDEFVSHRIDVPLDRTRLRRIGIAAIGRRFAADIAVAGIWLNA